MPRTSLVAAIERRRSGRIYRVKARADVHPTYAERWRRWRFNELSYLGGEAYLYPDLTTDWVQPHYVRADDSSEVEESVRRRVLYSFLFPFDSEDDWKYEQRRIMATVPNLVAPGVDGLVALVFSKPIGREAGGSATLARLWSPDADVDRIGTNWEGVIRDAAAGALIYGVAHAIADLPGEGDDDRELPYVKIISPLEMVDWRRTGGGGWGHATILEGTAADPVFRRWWSDRWEVLDGPGEDAKVLFAAPHSYGRVPIETIRCKRVGDPMLGKTPTDDAANRMQRVFNLESEKDVLERAQYPVMIIPGGGKLGRIAIGTASALDVQDAKWISPDAGNIDALRKSIADHVSEVRRLYGLSRGEGEQSIAARSGDALLVEISERTAFVAKLATEAADFERRLADLVLAVAGERAEGHAIHYPRTYDAMTPAERVTVTRELVSVPRMPGTVADTLVDRLWHEELAGLPLEEVARLEEAVAQERGATVRRRIEMLAREIEEGAEEEIVHRGNGA